MAGQKIRIKLAAYDHELVEFGGAAYRRHDEQERREDQRTQFRCPRKGSGHHLRSPHKYKDSREQFEIRTHKRIIDIIPPTQGSWTASISPRA